jgi:hypothetical protein
MCQFFQKFSALRRELSWTHYKVLLRVEKPESTGIDSVKIELYKGTVLETMISAGTPAGTGKYTWTIPANHPQGTNYKIKISGVEVGISDTGDRVFSITAAGN